MSYKMYETVDMFRNGFKFEVKHVVSNSKCNKSLYEISYVLMLERSK